MIQRSPSILKKRLQRMDRESLIALVSNNPKIDREQAERVVDKIEQGRDEVLRKMNKIEAELKEKTEKAKRESMRQIEAARKAAAAAWWVFLAAIVSGGASAPGNPGSYYLIINEHAIHFPDPIRCRINRQEKNE